MKHAKLVVRILLGLMMLVFGINKIIPFMPMPESMPENIINFMTALTEGHILLVVAVIEIITGIFFLVGRFTALATLLLLPVSFNFVLFHLSFDISGIVPGLIAFIMNLFLVYAHKDNYKGLLACK